MTTFADILNKQAEAIEKPKPRPLGTYYAVVQGMPKQKMVKDDTPLLDYMFKLTGAKQLNDSTVDPGDITEWAPMSKAFFLGSEENEYAHRQFLINTLGISADGGKTVGEMVAESPGKQVLVELKHEPYTDSNNEPQIATRIVKVARV